jgi:hypothetical protein
MSTFVRSKKTSKTVILYLVGGAIACVIMASFLGSNHTAATPTPVPELGTTFVVTSPVREGKYEYMGEKNQPLEVGEKVVLVQRTGLFANGKEVLQVAKVDDESFITYVTIDDVKIVSTP